MNELKLKAVMAENNTTQKELADFLGVAPSTLSAKIKGHREFLLSEIRAIKKLFRLTGNDVDAIFFSR